MKSILNNAIKGYVTSILGVLIICLTSYNASFGKIDWIWDGVVGCAAGAFFLSLSDKAIAQFFKQAFAAAINFYTKK